MSNSNRKAIEIVLIVAEFSLFAGAVATAYFSQKSSWTLFFCLSAVLGVIFVLLKIVQSFPRLKEIKIHETLAGKIASAAIPRGVDDYFDMQRPSEQDRRNAATQADIANAATMWLCANSGASYLDPGVYRHWPAIQKRLNQGINFRVVLLDPFSGEKAYRNQLNVNGEQFGSKMNLASLIDLYNRYQTLEVRFVRYGMHATVFAADDVLYVDPYTVGLIDDRIENRSYTLRIKRCEPDDGVGLYRIYKSHVDTLLRTSESFEAWLERCRAENKLPSGLPAVRARQYTA
ncbi:hypothetical protein [Pseudomonas aeruginosa]|uniref:hypothetical protein n=1 Tax=Pseudomonas aeruginosa TaxID=287 RepID=UPI00115D6D2D|nr:hypothetical protein [Pseudomonas aeruginosa]TRM39128.1 hypothetical protein FNL72_02835 [Pseudomonas aeruginosa]